MDPHDLALRGRLEAEGIVVPQILFGGEGETDDVIDRLDIIRPDVPFLQFLSIEGDIVLDICHDLEQPFP